MNTKNKDNIIISSLFFSLLVLVAYKLFYGVNNALFGVAFVCERLYSLGAKEDFDKCFDDFDYGEDSRKILIKTLVLIAAIIGMFVYITFTEPKILIFVVIGEILDVVIHKPYKKLTKKE